LFTELRPFVDTCITEPVKYQQCVCIISNELEKYKSEK
jgi:hypothetical protein